MDDALNKGEKIKKKVVKGVLGSKALENVLTNEKVVQGMSKAFTAKADLEKSLRKQLGRALKVFDVPSRADLKNMQNKISQLESEMDGIHRKIMSTKLRNAKTGTKKKASKVVKKKVVTKSKGRSLAKKTTRQVSRKTTVKAARRAKRK